MTLIGTVNNNFTAYKDILSKGVGYSVQLGDFGSKKIFDTYIDTQIDATKHQIIFGEKDFYPYLDYAFSLGDYGFFEVEGITYSFARGASTQLDETHYICSVKDWNKVDDILGWENQDNLRWDIEQLKNEEFKNMAEAMHHRNPKIMLSHTCPQEIAEHFFGEKRLSTTKLGLQLIWQTYQPDVWVFSHQEKSKIEKINGTLFVSLSHLQTHKI